MVSKAKTIREYLSKLSAPQRSTLEKLQRSIRAAAPKAVECISYQIPAYRLDGRLLVAFGAAKNHCSFFPMSSATIRQYKDELADFETSKGTIRFPIGKPLPASIVDKIVKTRVAQNAAIIADRRKRK